MSIDLHIKYPQYPRKLGWISSTPLWATSYLQPALKRRKQSGRSVPHVCINFTAHDDQKTRSSI